MSRAWRLLLYLTGVAELAISVANLATGHLAAGFAEAAGGFLFVMLPWIDRNAFTRGWHLGRAELRGRMMLQARTGERYSEPLPGSVEATQLMTQCYRDDGKGLLERMQVQLPREHNPYDKPEQENQP